MRIRDARPLVDWAEDPDGHITVAIGTTVKAVFALGVGVGLLVAALIIVVVRLLT